MNTFKAPKEFTYSRRRFLRTAAMSVAAAEFVTIGLADAQPGQTKSADTSRVKARADASFAPLVTVPAITLEGDANGAPHPDAGS